MFLGKQYIYSLSFYHNLKCVLLSENGRGGSNVSKGRVIERFCSKCHLGLRRGNLGSAKECLLNCSLWVYLCVYAGATYKVTSCSL